MGLFSSDVPKKSLAERLSSAKDIFRKAYDEATDVVADCVKEVGQRQEKIQTINEEIKEINLVKVETESFINKVKDLI